MFSLTLHRLTAITALALAVVFFVAPTLSFAQSSAFETGITIEATPASPEPFGEISVQLRSVNTDLTRAPIVWLVNGVEQTRGVGKTQFTTSAEDIGTRTTVTASIQTGVGVVQKSVSFVPTIVDILWEAPNSYTPPFYRGKALPASGTFIRAVAVPTFVTDTGARPDPETFVYTWKRNHSYRPFNDESGYGKRVISFALNYLRPNELFEAQVSSFGQTLTGQKRVLIDPTNPFIRVYEHHPLRGAQYHRALGEDFTMRESSETTLVAEPYFFDFYKGHAGIEYEWRVNGRAVEDTGSEQPNELVLRTEGGRGRADIAISATHADQLFQSARRSFNVVFGESVSDFFGF